MDTSRIDGVKASLRNGTPRSRVFVLHLGRQTGLKPSLDVLLPRAFVDGQPSHTTFPSIITEIGIGQAPFITKLGAGHGGCLGAAPSGSPGFGRCPAPVVALMWERLRACPQMLCGSGPRAHAAIAARRYRCFAAAPYASRPENPSSGLRMVLGGLSGD